MKSTKKQCRYDFDTNIFQSFGGFKYFAGHIWKHAINGPKEKKRTRK
jgi:hypothetical protein